MDAIAGYDAFFAGKAQEWALCEALRKVLLERWPQTKLRVMKTCVSFDDPKPYCYVSHPPRKSMEGILLSVSLQEKMEHSLFYRVVPVSASRFTVHIHVTREAQIDQELLELIESSRR